MDLPAPGMMKYHPRLAERAQGRHSQRQRGKQRSATKYLHHWSPCGTVTGQSSCTTADERVYITALGYETVFAGTKGLKAAGAGGLVQLPINGQGRDVVSADWPHVGSRAGLGLWGAAGLV